MFVLMLRTFQIPITINALSWKLHLVVEKCFKRRVGFLGKFFFVIP